jgi:hypothetical protein
MSRSNPQNDSTPNPASRWFEWNGEVGTVRYYDKDAKINVNVDLPFTFILLDELGSVKGWNEASKSAIYSNEIRDTRQDVLIVKAFKGGTLAEGLYKDIKDHVTSKSVGGQFTTNCYIAFKSNGAPLAMGGVQFKGSALGAWMEFRKAHRAELLTKAVRITGFSEGKKGRIVFRVPMFTITEITPESNTIAVALDVTLQTYLKAYLSRTKRDQVDTPTTHARDEPPPPPDDDVQYEPLTEDDIPF